MSRFRRFDVFDSTSRPLVVRETSICVPRAPAFPSFLEDELDFGFDLGFMTPAPFEIFDSVTDLVRIERWPEVSSYTRVTQRVGPEFLVERMCDRVSALESKFDRLVSSKVGSGDRKYTLSAEIKGLEDRKYKWTAEIKKGKHKEVEAKKNRKYKWTAEFEGKSDEGPISRKFTLAASSGDDDDSESIKGKHKEVEVKKDRKYKWKAEFEGESEEGPISRKFTLTAASGDDSDSGKTQCGKEKKEKKQKKEKKEVTGTRVVEIEEPADHGVIALRQAFARRAGAITNNRGKQKELSPQDAALMIQVTFRAYLIRRSKALRALRELAVAKSKLKEIRSLFNNFSYRRRVAWDAEERQRFSEKIIVLLLTVDAIEGADLMVRTAKKSMVDELEAMLDVIDPQPAAGSGRSLSMKRRTFDMPDAAIRKEIEEGVAQVVRMLEDED